MKSGEYCLRLPTKGAKTKRVAIVTLNIQYGADTKDGLVATAWEGDRCIAQIARVQIDCACKNYMSISGFEYAGTQTNHNLHKLAQWFLFYEDAP